MAEARSHPLRACPAQTDVARPVIEDPNEGWVTELGTLDEAVAFLWAQEQAMALDAWARCTFPDSYAGFRGLRICGWEGVATTSTSTTEISTRQVRPPTYPVRTVQLIPREGSE
ncbi:hypothetical protein [Kineococcus esterisolvens]|uniref:hypothetical protein n=1 Tax=unclassified Kineococcus TaxID=2621656 RepID=UPI003D7D3F79